MENPFYYVIGTVASQYGASFEVTRLTLPAGYSYLILGNVRITTGNQTTIAASLGGVDVGAMEKAIVNSGGALNCWGLVTKKDVSSTVQLISYGYLNATYNHVGTLMAIRLGRVTGGGGQ